MLDDECEPLFLLFLFLLLEVLGLTFPLRDFETGIRKKPNVDKSNPEKPTELSRSFLNTKIFRFQLLIDQVKGRYPTSGVSLKLVSPTPIHRTSGNGH
jgi:hypothetical protein